MKIKTQGEYEAALAERDSLRKRLARVAARIVELSDAIEEHERAAKAQTEQEDAEQALVIELMLLHHVPDRPSRARAIEWLQGVQRAAGWEVQVVPAGLEPATVRL